MDAGDAPGESVRRVEKGGVAVGDRHVPAEEFGGNRAAAGLDHGMDLFEQLDRLVRPAAPVAEESAANPHPLFAGSGDDPVPGQEVDYNVVIVAGVEGDVAPGFGDGAHHVESLVAVERRHLDCQHVVDLGELLPEFVRQRAAADAGLKVESDDRHDFRHGAAVFEHLFDGAAAIGAQADQPGVVAAFDRELRFIERLFGLAADSGDFEDFAPGAQTPFVDESGGFAEHRFEEPDLRVADFELGGVDADRDAARARVDIIAAEGALVARRKTTLRVERQRLGGDDRAAPHLGEDGGVDIGNAFRHSRHLLEFAVVDFEMGRFAERGTARLEPFGLPADHPVERDGGIAEGSGHLRRVIEIAAARSGPGPGVADLFSHIFAELFGDRAERGGFGAGDVEHRRRGVGEFERAQRDIVGIALPDHVEVADAVGDRLVVPDLGRDVMQHAVAQIDRIVEAEEQHAGAERLGAVLEHPFASEAGLGVFADRSGRNRLGAAAGFRADQRIDATGGKSDDPGVAEMFRHIARRQRVHRPGQLLGAAGAELAPGHEDDIGNLRKFAHPVAVEQVAGDGFDAPRLELFAFLRAAEARDTDHLAVDARQFHGAFGAPPHGDAHLPGDAENHQVAVEPFHQVDQFRRRDREQVFQFRVRYDSFRVLHHDFFLSGVEKQNQPVVFIQDNATPPEIKSRNQESVEKKRNRAETRQIERKEEGV